MAKAPKRPQDFADDVAVSQYMGSMSEIKEGLQIIARNKKSGRSR